MTGMFRRLHSRPVEPTLQSFDWGSRRIEFLWVRGTGRRLRIEVSFEGKVRVHSPSRATFDQVLPFVLRKASWIVRTLAKVEAYERLIWPTFLSAGDSFFFFGRLHRTEWEWGPRFSVRFEDSSLRVTAPPAGDPTRLGGRIVSRLREEAERTLQDRVERCLPIALALGIPAPRVSFRMMKRRWGSCGRDGRVVLNVRLVQTPPECVDYVILHELCHLRHHNHGRAFQALLALGLPDWKQRRELLKRYVIS